MQNEDRFNLFDSLLRRLDDGAERIIKPGLERIALLLEELGHPERDFPAIHIAGTNGKGSTAAMLAAILRAEGLRVGLFTSPHLNNYRERIRIDGHMVSAEDLEDVAKELIAYTDTCRTEERPSPFEAITAAAFACFRQAKVDIAIVEAGMGGRWDATNYLSRVLLSIITNVAMDHCDYLGDNIAAIASEKAGIIKARLPVITGATGEALQVISTEAAALQSPLMVLGRDITWLVKRDAGSERHFLKVLQQGFFETDWLPLLLCGDHQEANAALAVAAAVMLPEPLNANAADLDLGMSSVRWPGRLELFPGSPDRLLDGAHNPAGIEALCRYLAGVRSGYTRLVGVIGILCDKDVSAMMSRLTDTFDELFLVAPGNARAMTPQDILRLSPDRRKCTLANNLPGALAAAEEAAGENGLICIVGSLYLVAEARRLISEDADVEL